MVDWGYPVSRKRHRASRNPCNGCHECGLRCTAGVQMAEDEFTRIVEHLRSCDPMHVLRVLEQEKTVVWSEEATVEACLFYDVKDKGCLIYPVRPLICRLFGRVEWLPCPLERDLPQLHGGLELIQTYARQRRATFPEWCQETGIFDLRELVSEGR